MLNLALTSRPRPAPSPICRRVHGAQQHCAGKGQFGTCRIVTAKATGAKYACKSISKRRLCSQGDVVDVRREVQIMHHLAGHPNIVTIKDVFEDRSYVHMVEELCTGGELFDSIIERGHYSERDAAAAFRCIASVVAHCHNMGVMHRDIKPENFLLSSRSPDATIKATDFGLSVFFSEGQVFREVVGSAFYVAPEVLRKRYDKRADVWSLGVLLYIMLCGLPPFYAETERDVFHAILTKEVSFDGGAWSSVSEGAKDVIRKMLDRNLRLRATAAEVLEHDWVREDGTAEEAPLNNEVLVRLQNFAALNKLQQEALKIIATHLPEPEITGLRALFMEMDSDGSGSITVEELRQALRRKGTLIPAEELERIMAQADISGDGVLDYEEFLAATMNLAKLESQENLYMAFKFFDTDDSGYITREELSQALSKTCSAPEIDALLAQADSSGDGRIDYAEFCDLMRGGNKAFALASRSCKQGLMRSHGSEIDLSKLRLESVSALDYATLTNLAQKPSSPSQQQQKQQQQTAQCQPENVTEQLSSVDSSNRSTTGTAATAAAIARLSSPNGLMLPLHATPTPRRLNPSMTMQSAAGLAAGSEGRSRVGGTATGVAGVGLGGEGRSRMATGLTGAMATTAAATELSPAMPAPLPRAHPPLLQPPTLVPQLPKSPLSLSIPAPVGASVLHAASFTCAPGK
ncbi:hypothetical protein Vretimale_13530 [Volvox reticuliferus]|uniref:non-specific serine/threonine protein kinase n=1 Tax=Volvox reticuliferus TaxID=1737510 RepID=A0A8J4GKE4_9CHLO|nr:hypothetical protein Vretimale_13530 [Volvox reticuliferus]